MGNSIASGLVIYLIMPKITIKKELSKVMQELSNAIAKKYDEVIDKIRNFSDEYLNDQYKDVCLEAAKTLFFENQEVVKKGKSISWAAGIMHAIGSINDLFDSKMEPYIKATDLYKEFEVSSSTATTKSKEVKTLLNLSAEDEKWLVKKDVNKTETRKQDKENDQNKENFKITVDREYVVSQKIVDLAWKQKSFTNKYKTAMQALSIYKECADAYIILSRDSRLTESQKVKYLKRAVKAAENVLKISNMEDADPRIFTAKVAEPLFGAKYLLATKLWTLGNRDEAINTALEIVKYDRTDKMLVRGLVSSWLLIDDRNDDAKIFLSRINNDFIAATNYNRAVMFYRDGDMKNAEISLRRAFERNLFVIDYLLKHKNLPSKLPHMSKLGGEEEAMKYVKVALPIWNDDELIKWLKENKKNFEILDFSNSLQQYKNVVLQYQFNNQFFGAG
eukprot:TRINITY_DN1072_c0_g1_i2.p1 TRINITY_DN1072_c0_g1~~TRINITY_DN1072_c0_g1_i2.p1  ORF type:complete len:448 (-),score=86.98 TRINITY_DN1072_c0_g1_i2:1125-2468(-)